MPDPQIASYRRVQDEIGAREAGKPVAVFVAEREAKRVADELAQAKAQEVADAALEQTRVDRELGEFFEDLRALPRVFLHWYTGATVPADIPPQDRRRLRGSLKKHLARFVEQVDRDR